MSDGPDLQDAARKLAAVVQGDALRRCAAFFESPMHLDSSAVVAVSLQEADMGGTTRWTARLCQAGETVAELARREAELHPEVTRRSTSRASRRW